MRFPRKIAHRCPDEQTGMRLTRLNPVTGEFAAVKVR